MAIVVTPNLTLINNCDATTGWSGGTQVTIGQIQGSACMGDAVSATTGSLRTYAVSALNFTGKFLYVWMMCGGVVDTKANGGYRVHLQSTTGNNKTWYVGGNDTHGGGWHCFVVDPTTSADVENGTLDVSNINLVGVQFKTLTTTRTIGKEVVENVFWDVLRFGTGLTITSGASDGIGIAEAFAEDDDSDNKYGIIQRVNGVYFVQGTLTLGDGSGTDSIDWEVSNEIIVFIENGYISSSFHKIQVVGNGTGTTNVSFAGCVIKASGSYDFAFSPNKTRLNKLKGLEAN